MRRRILPRCSHLPLRQQALRGISDLGDTSMLRRMAIKGLEEQQPTSNVTTSTSGAGFGENTDRGASSSPSVNAEWLSLRDPLGGMWHKDFYRDPARGYTPQAAPRNFAEGGAVEYMHPPTPLHFAQSLCQRDSMDHELQRQQEVLRSQREALRQCGSDAEAASALAAIPFSESAQNFSQSKNEDLSVDALFSSFHGATLHENQTRDWYMHLPPAAASLPGEDLISSLKAQMDNERFSNEKSLMNEIHGFPAEHRFQHELAQRLSRKEFRGYDMDRFRAQKVAFSFGNLVSPSQMTEAQTELRRNAVSDRESFYAQMYHANTVAESPKTGQDLTEHIVATSEAKKREVEREMKKERDEVLGLGRQGPLVQEGGPDKRIIDMRKNDERLLHAAEFKMNAYRQSARDGFDQNPYARNNMDEGMSQLLTNSFDISRRNDRNSQQEVDPSERSMFHYGVPIPQQIDATVHARRGARGERPIEFFMPFPSDRELRLWAVFRDCEGFALAARRPSVQEWELFVRYRAHHQQRRWLALRHSLEPRANETMQETEQRRERLDALCEETAFEESKMTRATRSRKGRPTASQLRQWFGAYLLPSPTTLQKVMSAEAQAGLHVAESEEEDGVVDSRENLLSARYINRLLTVETFLQRVREYRRQHLGRVPEPSIPLLQSQETLRKFSKEERAMYNEYVKLQFRKHLEQYKELEQNTRWIEDFNQHGSLTEAPIRVDSLEVKSVRNGEIMVIPYQMIEAQLANAKGAAVTIDVEGVKEDYIVQGGTRRTVVVHRVQLENGSTIEMEDSEWSSLPLKAQDADPNAHLNVRMPRSVVNRVNYIETQDAIWEERTAQGIEGWSPALVNDVLVGMPVQARRFVGDGIRGPFERGEVVEVFSEPFLNPAPQDAKVRFFSDGMIERVELKDILVWQLTWCGPERTVPDETLKYPAGATRRFVDFADPKGDRVHMEPHFLDAYAAKTSTSPFRSVKPIMQLDAWNNFDIVRRANFRQLSIHYRKDYIRGHYFYNYTPWEFIVHQEADQPLLWSQLRNDDVGPSYFVNPNRYWRYKRRPHGYIRNYENEVRDLFQYVDGVTPWKKAQLIRTHWEVRQHFPMPSWNRPIMAMHRNTPRLLPLNMWDADKKTGKVRALKDSVKDYKSSQLYPSWVSL